MLPRIGEEKAKGELVTTPEHMPHSHREHLEWTPSRLTQWASGNGPATGRLVTEILKRRPHPVLCQNSALLK